MQQEDYTHVTYTETTDKKTNKEDFPFDLNNLCNFQYSFDVLKKAIEYLAKQQKNQETLIVDLIESSKTITAPGARPFEVVPDQPQSQQEATSADKAAVVPTSSPANPKVVERIVERVASAPQKDWEPLMNDFDKRLDTLEKNTKAQD